MKRNFTKLQHQSFDLLVYGGGIYGAWIAYDAALRGLKVAIIEKNDWASATSSASSKLIHGGLRYLETFDCKLVRKALIERNRLLQIAPHRVWPLRFGIPVYASSRIGRLKLKLGLSLYDFLAGSALPEMSHHYFSCYDFIDRFSALNKHELTGGFTYADAQTDDARFVLELIAGAQEAGAVCLNYCKLTQIIEVHGQASGAIFKDQQNGNTGEMYAKKIVNATGQWIATSKQGKTWCRLAKGVHLVMPNILNDEALLLTAKSDGRVFFLIPWYGATLLGTTDTDYNETLEQVRIETKDICYLLEAANGYLGTRWSQADIVSKYAGVRVLRQHTPPSAPLSSISRDWALNTLKNGVHYSVGGKITSARQDAASIVSVVCTQLGSNASCETANKLFPWAPADDFLKWCAVQNFQASQLGIDSESAKWLIRRHGTRVVEIYRRIKKDPKLAQRIVSSLPFVYADLLHCAHVEMVVRLDDLLRRRMPLLILTQLTKIKLQQLAKLVAPILNWDDISISREIENCSKQ